jgi:hypothetical protein
MSRIDDEIAEIEEKLDRALEKCAYGRKYSPAYRVAREIKMFRKILSKKCGNSRTPAHELFLLWPKIEALLLGMEDDEKSDPVEWNQLRWFAGAGWGLLVGAVCDSKRLREVANALDALDAEKRVDPHQ